MLSHSARTLLTLISATAMACAPVVFNPPTQSTACASAGADSSRVVDTLAVQEKPRMRSAPSVQYPPDAQMRGIPGNVLLNIIIGVDGLAEPTSLRVVAASDSIFVPPAQRAILATKWWPGCLNGKRARVRERVAVKFRLATT